MEPGRNPWLITKVDLGQVIGETHIVLNNFDEPSQNYPSRQGGFPCFLLKICYYPIGIQIFIFLTFPVELSVCSVNDFPTRINTIQKNKNDVRFMMKNQISLYF